MPTTTDGEHGRRLRRGRVPGGDGFDLALALARDERTYAIPLVFLSAESGAAERACTRGVRAAAFVSKPFDPQLLAPFLRHAIAWNAGRGATAPAAA